MAATTRFYVLVTELRGRDIGSAKCDPYLKLNFDNFVTWKTEVIKRSSTPVWSTEKGPRRSSARRSKARFSL